MKYHKRLTGEKENQIYPPLYFIFTYDSKWKRFGILLKNIVKIIKENNIKPSERFDFLYVMRKGLKSYWDISSEIRKERGVDRGIINQIVKYKDIIPINERWPQFFPSRLISELKLELHEIQVTQSEGREEGYLASLNIENQILGMIDFLRTLCQAVEDHKSLDGFNIISGSYTKKTRHGSGRVTPEGF